MDGSRFDDLTRALAAGTSRRGLLKSMLRGALAGVAATTGVRPGAAGAKAKDKVDPDRKNPFSRAGKRCGRGQPCGQLVPCLNGVCTPTVCLIGGTIRADGEVNPDNSCEVCEVTLDSWTEWTPLANGASCGPDLVCCGGACCAAGECCGEDGTCESCGPHCEIEGTDYADGVSNPTHDCQVCDPDRSEIAWSPVDDLTACGGVPGRVCCNGECCSPTECCTEAGRCEECGPHCLIDHIVRDDREVNPAEPCQLCDPDRNPEGWSQAENGTVCGGDLDAERVCCAGECCPEGQCCVGGACGPCPCEIDGRTFERDETEPGNKCNVCNPDLDRDDWTAQPRNTPCGLTNDRFCCAGVCCPSGECCNQIGECAPCGCEIGTLEVVADGVNPANTCQVCRPDENRLDWTVLGDGDACGNDLDDRVCCGGSCCPQGQCCEGGTCRDCGCDIGNDDNITPGTINPDNVCQVCDPTRARLAWSPVLGENVTCGEDRVCCDGDCCDPGQCCLLGACGECLCSIGDDVVAAGTSNPDNFCEICDPDREPFDWLPKQDKTPCGNAGERVCCSGECCAEGLCCILGVCGTCGCEIGDGTFAEFAINPDNECEWCDPVLDRFVWSPRSDEPCGESGEQVCCGGVCCASGQCCSLAGACAACPCQIGDQFFDNGVANPENACEVCDSASDRFAWSAVDDDTPCGDAGDQKCCSGICCPSGTCCIHGVCSSCVCTIGEDTFDPFVPNPTNVCEQCDPTLDPFNWTPDPEDPPCGENGDQRCCNGVCCPLGACCTTPDLVCEQCRCVIDGKEYEDRSLNPQNECEICDIALDPLAWTPMSEEAFCGPAGNQVCCSGTCCPLGEHCSLAGACGPSAPGCTIDGVFYLDGVRNPNDFCQVCNKDYPTQWSPRLFPDCPPPCTIGGVLFAYGAVNPDNACQECRGGSSWSASDALVCGAALDQLCCDGACCAAGECCTAAGICGMEECTPEGCTIDGAQFANGTLNPANPCQVCDEAVSKTSWSPSGFGSCGPNGDQFCAGGVCCDLGICPNGGVCGDFCDAVCVIDGILYHNGDRNPAIQCQACAASISHTSWTQVGANLYCDPVAQTGACCGAICCGAGSFCNENGMFCDHL